MESKKRSHSALEKLLTAAVHDAFNRCGETPKAGAEKVVEAVLAAIHPTYVTPERARQELGNCSNSYLYELLGEGLLRSVNPGGRRRLIELASIRELLQREDRRPTVAQKQSQGAAAMTAPLLCPKDADTVARIQGLLARDDLPPEAKADTLEGLAGALVQRLRAEGT